MGDHPAIADQNALLGQFLAGRDTPCPSCGYNLRDLQSQRCPECAQDLELSVKLVEPRQGALIAGLIALSAGMGLSGLLMIYGIIASLRFSHLADLDRFFVINGVGFFVHAIAVLLWVRNWRRIRLFANRRALAIGCWGLPLVEVILLATYIK